MDEKIKTLMQSLDITEQEAIELIAEDEEIDKMDMSEVDNDLTTDQKKTKKKMSSTGVKAVDAYGRQRKVERKADETKRQIIQELNSVVTDLADEGSITLTNIERQIDFQIQGRKFRIVLSAPRK